MCLKLGKHRVLNQDKRNEKSLIQLMDIIFGANRSISFYNLPYIKEILLYLVNLYKLKLMKIQIQVPNKQLICQ